MKGAAAPSPKSSLEPAARRRTRSSSSFASSLSSIIPSPSPSPARYFFPLRPSSAVPFSWEHLPGVPKNPKSLPSPAGSHRRLLPLPPPLRSKSDSSITRKKRSDARFFDPATADPFAAALAECAKEDPSGTQLDELWGEPTAGARRRSPAAITFRFRFFDLYSSCKTSCSVAEATISVPRSSHRPAAYGLISRRSSS